MQDRQLGTRATRGASAVAYPNDEWIEPFHVLDANRVDHDGNVMRKVFANEVDKSDSCRVNCAGRHQLDLDDGRRLTSE